MSRNLELLQRAEQEAQQHRAAAQEGVASTQPEPTVIEGNLDEEAQVAAAASESYGDELQPIAGLDPLCRNQMTNMIQRLFLGAQHYRTVIFSSVERRAGCTWAAASCASMLAANASGSVCLVDGNTHWPSIHDLFRISNEQGLVDALGDSVPLTKFVQQGTRPNLWVLPSGTTQNGHTVMAVKHISARMQELTSEFDYVIIDAPAINLYSDAITLGCSSDGLVLVLKANSSRRESAQKALQDAKAANVRVLGAILNQRTFPIPEAIYKRL